jgi:hypothetical protein
VREIIHWEVIAIAPGALYLTTVAVFILPAACCSSRGRRVRARAGPQSVDRAEHGPAASDRTTCSLAGIQ